MSQLTLFHFTMTAARQRPLGEKGQVVIEYVLYTVLTVALITLLTTGIRNADFFGKVTYGPWKRIAAVIETGVWVKSSGNPMTAAREQHPNHRSRNLSCRPDGSC